MFKRDDATLSDEGLLGGSMIVYKKSITGILFDLDGTLIDSAPDLGGALNAMRIRRGLAVLPLTQLRPFASHGARGLLWAGFGMNESHPDYVAMRDEFLEYYEQHAADTTQLFDGVAELLDLLDQKQMVWGIITNKYQRFTSPVVQALGLDKRAHVIVCGDTTPHSKPHPEPLLYAAQQIKCAPEELVYVGDDQRDIQAARAANYAIAIAAGYGYADALTIPDWRADACIQSPAELARWLAG